MGQLQEYAFSGIGLMVCIMPRILRVVFEFANVEFFFDRFHERQVRLFIIIAFSALPESANCGRTYPPAFFKAKEADRIVSNQVDSGEISKFDEERVLSAAFDSQCFL